MSAPERLGKETPEAYAQRRANETRTCYHVTSGGRAEYACKANVASTIDGGETIVRTYRPESVTRVTDVRQQASVE